MVPAYLTMLVTSLDTYSNFLVLRDDNGTVDSESALRSAGILMSGVRAPQPALWPDGGPKILRSLLCKLALYKKPSNQPGCDSVPNYRCVQ
ncbi:hypothetical protein PoB_005959600 [Plakobranchus ocellatus]|uniref:Uncharacterized protein n=1 Tax=Plakobranchus ocellatus TaxID=259542 RepID=A0AAV4CMH8_9GAST|nr:hypothetical protein PoB_005959600 [Plakobranchus ocellatus]